MQNYLPVWPESLDIGIKAADQISQYFLRCFLCKRETEREWFEDRDSYNCKLVRVTQFSTFVFLDESAQHLL